MAPRQHSAPQRCSVSRPATYWEWSSRPRRSAVGAQYETHRPRKRAILQPVSKTTLYTTSKQPCAPATDLHPVHVATNRTPRRQPAAKDQLCRHLRHTLEDRDETHRYKMVVLPAPSRPRMRMRISLSPHRREKSAEKMLPGRQCATLCDRRKASVGAAWGPHSSQPRRDEAPNPSWSRGAISGRAAAIVPELLRSLWLLLACHGGRRPIAHKARATVSARSPTATTAAAAVQ